MAKPPYTLVFYEDESGEQPALAWMRGLTSTKRRALGVALHEVLSHEGVDVCTSEFGKPLGDGLFEFRLRHDSQEILALKGRLKRAVASATGSEKVLLRVFFHPHGDKLILLLGGYDKGRFSGRKRQATEIAVARKRLALWQRRDA